MIREEYVCGFAFSGQKVALVTKSKPEWQRGKLNGVGGKVEETDVGLTEAMRREFEEETCLLIEEWEHFLTLHTKGVHVHFFRTEVGNPLFKLKGTAEEPVNWYNIGEVLTSGKTIGNLRWLIPMARTQQVSCPAEVWE